MEALLPSGANIHANAADPLMRAAFGSRDKRAQRLIDRGAVVDVSHVHILLDAGHPPRRLPPLTAPRSRDT